MADLDIYFEAAIPPKAKGRPRTAVVNGHARVFTPAETRRWEQDFAAIAARHAPGQVIDVPTRVDVLAVMPRPKRLLRARDAEGLVWCESRPDADNIRKAVLDAMAAWWRDDALVVSGQTIKAHAGEDGTPARHRARPHPDHRRPHDRRRPRLWPRPRGRRDGPATARDRRLSMTANVIPLPLPLSLATLEHANWALVARQNAATADAMLHARDVANERAERYRRELSEMTSAALDATAELVEARSQCCALADVIDAGTREVAELGATLDGAVADVVTARERERAVTLQRDGLIARLRELVDAFDHAADGPFLGDDLERLDRARRAARVELVSHDAAEGVRRG